MVITMGSLFSGIGAPELAGERCGISTLWASEIDPQAASVHARHFPRTYQLGDIRHVGKHNAAPVDIVVGGSPCQDLSIAGKRSGLVGERSGLFHEYIRVIRELRPSFALWENVPGALTSHNGRDFARVLGAFHDIGARDIAWRVFDAAHFGVPQRRRRVFLVADFRDCRAGEILFERESVAGYRPTRRKAGSDIAYALTTGNQRLDASNSETFIGVAAYDPLYLKASSLAPTLKSHSQGGPGAQTMPLIAGTLRAGSAGRRFQEGNYGDSLIPTTMPVYYTHERNQDRIYSTDGLAPALTAQDSNKARNILTVNRVRRLMPVECERLMGFPDGWTRWGADNAEMADTPRYRMLGNSIAVPVIEWIIRRMVELF